jgi:hypothetical protein
MTSDTTARTVSKIALFVLLIVLLYDAYLTAVNSHDTISNVISQFNAQTGGLIALAIAVLWIHWFVPLPDGWTSEPNRTVTT